jgi:hypothetical protein
MTIQLNRKDHALWLFQWSKIGIYQRNNYAGMFVVENTEGL